MAIACPSDPALAAYIDGTLAGSDRHALEQHVDGCDTCRHLIAELARTLPPRAESAEDGAGERYEIVEQLGAGAMGAVYVARDTELDREVALKILHPPDFDGGHAGSTLSVNQPGSSGRAERDRLREEARALAKLSHRNIVQVYDVGELDGEVFIAMELVVGTTLRAWLDEDPTRSWQDVLEVFTEAGRGLAAAHGAGIVHRDFKPENVLVATDGRVTVTDFGLATQALDHTSSASDAVVSYASASNARGDTTVAGTPAYMAPELFDGRPADASSDQYSFCVALHEGLYRKRPSDADADSGARVPRWLRGIVSRGLAKLRTERFPSMPSLLDHIEGRRKRGRRVRYGGVALLGTAAVIRGAMWFGAATNDQPATPAPTPAITAGAPMPVVDAAPALTHAEIQIEINTAKAERKKKKYKAVMTRLDGIEPLVDPPKNREERILLARIQSLRCRTWSRLKNRNAAADACIRAIKLNEVTHGPDYNDVINDVIKVSVILTYAKRWAEAETYLVRALELARKHRAGATALEFVLMNELGQVYLETERYKRAVGQLDAAVTFYERHKLKQVSLHVSAYERLSRALWALGRKKEALAAARRGLVAAKPKPPKALVKQLERWIKAHEQQ